MPVSLDATTGQHLGDRTEQQDRVAIIPSKKLKGTALVIVADGAGGYKGGAAAAEQVIGTAANLFDAYSPKDEKPEEFLREIMLEAHTVIRLNRVLTEEEPHSTIIATTVLCGSSSVGTRLRRITGWASSASWRSRSCGDSLLGEKFSNRLSAVPMTCSAAWAPPL